MEEVADAFGLGAVVEDYDGAESTAEFQYVEAGSLESDGEYFYQYDAWNRLIQVNRALFDNQAMRWGADPDRLVKHHTYDGLGRLARTQHDLPSGGGGGLRVIDLYYDGVRRVQEAIDDPTEYWHPQNADHVPNIGTDVWVDREYVHAPFYVDQYLCQIDFFGFASYLLQDANFNVMAVVNPSGAVAAQFTYDAYGEVLTAEPSTFANLKMGFQGLPWYRLDDGGGGILGPQMAAGAVGILHARNRWLVPQIGRWSAMDPFLTGLVTVSLSPRGSPPRPTYPSALSLDRAHMDGLNRHIFCAANPCSAVDPEGLVLDQLKGAAIQAERYQQAYDTGKKVMDLFYKLRAGLAWEQVALGLAADLAMDKLGGRALDKVLDQAKNLWNKIGRFASRAGQTVRVGRYNVTFDSLGFPDLAPHRVAHVEIRVTGRNNSDQAEAWRKALEEFKLKKEDYPNYTWHHHQDGKTMELVPSELNAEIDHLGGGAIIRQFLDE